VDSWSAVLRREILRSKRVAVVGAGHIGRGDDAAGTLIARRLLDRTAPLPANALVIAAEEAPENFTGVVRAFAPDLTILVDAAHGGRPAGSIFLIDLAEIAEDDVSTHRIPLARLARYVRETMGCRVLLLGIEPASLAGRGEGAVSPVVDRAVRKVADILRRALASG
jgi:hydrogenase 3 maturation protease